MKLDLKTPRSRNLYLLCLAAITYGVVFADWIPVAIVLALVEFFSRGFLAGIKLARHGRFARIRIREIQQEIGGVQGVNQNVLVDGQSGRAAHRPPTLSPTRCARAKD